jgi:PEGA domain
MRPPFVSILAALLVSSSAIAGAAAPASSELVEARKLFAEAVAAGEAGRWRDATDKYEASLRIKRAPITLYSLGVALREAGRTVAAMHRFRAFLAEPFEDSHAAVYRKAARQALEEMAFKVGRVVVEVQPAEARVTIDGEPCLSGPEACLVDAGTHRVVAVRAGYEPVERAVVVEKGRTATVALSLEEAGTPLWPILLASTGGVAFATGVALSVVGMKGPPEERDLPMAVTGEVLVGTGLAAGAVGAVVLAISGGDDLQETAVAPWSEGSVAGVQLRF